MIELIAFILLIVYALLNKTFLVLLDEILEKFEKVEKDIEELKSKEETGVLKNSNSFIKFN